MKTKIESGVTVSPYMEAEKRVVKGKVVYVTYNAIDWKKNFAGAPKNVK